MSKIDQELQDQLRAVLAAGVSDDAMKAVKKAAESIVYDIETDLEYRIKDDLADHLVGWVVDMATNAVEQILAGNEDQMRRYLSCEKRGPDGEYIGWTGRSDAPSYGLRRREPHEWHQVIHGKLFEHGAVALRKSIVEAHRDMFGNERILDLEDQVKSLVAQVNRKEEEIARQRHDAGGMQPRLTDNDSGEINVALNEKPLRAWHYRDDAERRKNMLLAREYIEGWCDGRSA